MDSLYMGKVNQKIILMNKGRVGKPAKSANRTVITHSVVLNWAENSVTVAFRKLGDGRLNTDINRRIAVVTYYRDGAYARQLFEKHHIQQINRLVMGEV